MPEKHEGIQEDHESDVRIGRDMASREDSLSEKDSQPDGSAAAGDVLTERRRFFNRGMPDDDEPMPSGHWAVPWSDLMMVAFVMFAVLYSYVLSHRDLGEALRKPPESIPAEAQTKEAFRLPEAPVPSTRESRKAEAGDNISMEEFYETLQNTVRVSNLDDVTVAVGQNRIIKVTVGEPMLFDLGRADLKPEAVRFLRELSEKISKTRFKIIVEGHTDSFPIHNETFPTNWELSAIRAVRVVRFLIEDARLEPERFSVAGYSMYRPIAPNSTLRNKAMNRRVEMVITGEKIE